MLIMRRVVVRAGCIVTYGAARVVLEMPSGAVDEWRITIALEIDGVPTVFHAERTEGPGVATVMDMQTGEFVLLDLREHLAAEYADLMRKLRS